MTALATAFVRLRVDGSDVEPGIRRSLTGAAPAATRAGDDAGRKFGHGFVSSSTKLIAGLGASALVYKTGQLIGDSIDKASDLNETLNKSDTIFGKNAQTIRTWSQSSATSFGLSREAALAATAGFGDMFLQLGFTDKAAVKASTSTVKMAADLGSFSNLETGDVLDRISAALRGEYDSLQAVIPNINAARVEKEALAATGKKVATELTAEEKATATLAIVQRDGARAAGDFAKTSDGLANSKKILAAQIDNVEAKLGKALLPLEKDFVHFLSREGIPVVNKFSAWFQREGGPALRDFADDLKPAARELLPALADAMGTTRDVLREAVPLATGFVNAFNSLPDGVKKAVVAGGLAAGLAAKIPAGGGKNLLESAAGKIATKASPVPVFVTNPGVGIPGVLGGGKTPPVAVPGGGGGGKFPALPLGLVGGVVTLATVGSINNSKPLRDEIPHMKALMQVLLGLNDALGVTKSGTKALDEAFVNLVSTNPDKAMKLFTRETGKAGLEIDDFNSLLPRTTGMLDLTGTLLEGIGRKHPKPSVTLDDKAKKPLDFLQAYLKQFDGTTATATADVNTAPAVAKINHVQQLLAGLSVSDLNLPKDLEADLQNLTRPRRGSGRDRRTAGPTVSIGQIITRDDQAVATAIRKEQAKAAILAGLPA